MSPGSTGSGSAPIPTISTIPTILTLAGSDSSGGAGIQADLKAISANGGYGASVVTAITAQNTRGVSAAGTIPADLIEAQIEAVFSDLTVAAVKTGMLGSADALSAVAAGLARHAPPHVVCDPVMISKTGFALLPGDCVEGMVRDVIPKATLVTPNVHEAAALSGRSVETPGDAAAAGRVLLDAGAAAVLVKGGHLKRDAATDVLVTPGGVREFRGEFVPSRHTHGTGCTFSAAIATHLGRGLALEKAIALAKEFITEAIRHGLPVGGGTGPTDPFWFLRRAETAADWIRRLEEDPGEG